MLRQPLHSSIAGWRTTTSFTRTPDWAIDPRASTFFPKPSRVRFNGVNSSRSFTVAALAAAGVKRISLATSLYRAAMTGLLNAAKEVREQGTFGYIDTSLATPEMNAFLRQ